MRYISTRGGVDPVMFREAVLMGLAPDGGLLIPESIPDVRARLPEWRQLSYPDLALQIISLFSDLQQEEMREIVMGACRTFRAPDVAPVVEKCGIHIVELFHGPTLAFKDVALQFLGRLFERILRDAGGHLNVLAATSGDTGSAAIQGLRSRERINIFVLFPDGRVSEVQRRQMTTVEDANVSCIAIDGTFDDCQEIVKGLFRDKAFKKRRSLGAVNSINWARLAAQIVYYFYSAFRVMDATSTDRVQFSVPTGNFGDIFAGYLAARMGLPVERLILACNENDILARFFNEGVYRRGRVRTTLSPSMDIQVASNYERYLYYFLGEDASRTAAVMEEFAETGVIAPGKPRDRLFAAGMGDTESTLATIREFYEREGYLVDPHTAVGLHVGRNLREEGCPLICLATAHAAKFPEAVIRAVQKDVAHHPLIDALQGRSEKMERLPATKEVVRAFLEEKAGKGGPWVETGT